MHKVKSKDRNIFIFKEFWSPLNYVHIIHAVRKYYNDLFYNKFRYL